MTRDIHHFDYLDSAWGEGVCVWECEESLIENPIKGAKATTT